MRFDLRWDREFSHTIDAIRVLTRRGLSVADAKNAIEILMQERFTTVTLPTVENVDAVIQEIAMTGATATVVMPVMAT